MKKNLPAKKGSGPAREKKFGNGNKPAGSRNRPFTGKDQGEKTTAKDDQSSSPFKRERKFGGKSFDKGAGGFDKPDNKSRKADDKPAFRNKFDKQPGDQERTGGFGNKPRKTDDKPAFRSKFDKQQGESAGDRPLRKRTYKNGNDDSAFHFHGDSKKGGKETPSGFNRQKFFDKANERFADKQERKIQRKTETSDAKPAKEPKQSSFGPGEMPLNKFVAHCGLCSRRKAVDYIKEGKISVNGAVVFEPATKVTAQDVVTMQQKRITPTKNLVYILLNKPKGYITTTDDPEGRKTVMDLIEEAAENERVYPVGRLDRNTSGLLLLTNDGELAQRLAHPKHNIKKIYQVELDKPLTKTDFDKILAGVTLEDGVAVVDALGYVDPRDKKQLGIEIHSGKNRIVRRIFEHLGYTVEKLDRVMYAGLTKKNLNRGQWRFLTEKEVIVLKHFKTNL